MRLLARVFLVSFIALMVSGVVEASERYELRFRNRSYSYSTVDLKYMLQRQHGVNADNYILERVRVRGESFRPTHRTRIELIVAGRLVDWDEVYTTRYRVLTTNQLTNRGHSDGSWILKTRGVLRIDSITVYVQKKRHTRHRAPANYFVYQIGTLSAGMGNATVHTYSLGDFYVQDISLRGRRNSVRIHKVEIVYDNGRRMRLRNLEGTLDVRERKTVSVDRPVSYVVVTARTRNPNYGQGLVEVFAR